MTDPVNNPVEPPVETNPAPAPSVMTPPADDSNPGDQNPPTEPPVTPVVPESIDGYEVNVEGFDFDEFKAIPENQEFLERARAAGFDNEKLGFLLGEYNELIPTLMEANAALDNDTAVQKMTEVWGGEADQNFKYAHSAAGNLIANGVLTAEEVNDPSFGNNPLVLKMAAYFGSQLQEDTPPSNTQQSGGVDVESLMKSEAYLNESHPDHKRVFSQVQNFYQKQYK